MARFATMHEQLAREVLQRLVVEGAIEMAIGHTWEQLVDRAAAALIQRPDDLPGFSAPAHRLETLLLDATEIEDVFVPTADIVKVVASAARGARPAPMFLN